jgi:hypothetical protein
MPVEVTAKGIWFRLHLSQKVSGMGQNRGVPEAVGQVTEDIRQNQGIKWRWQSLDSASIKALLGGTRLVLTRQTEAS